MQKYNDLGNKNRIGFCGYRCDNGVGSLYEIPMKLKEVNEKYGELINFGTNMFMSFGFMVALFFAFFGFMVWVGGTEFLATHCVPLENNAGAVCTIRFDENK